MRRAAVGIALGLALASGAAGAKGLDPATADAIVAKARADGANAFCKAPRKPIAARAHVLCPLAREVKGCEELVAACEDVKEPPAWDFGGLGRVFSSIANVLVWGLVAGVVAIILWFIATAITRAQRDRQAAEKPAPRPARAVPDHADVLETATDAELLLRQAQEHAQRGDLDRAAGLYLAASLRALDDRGAIRIARHRTNGEYVRSCKEPETKPDLRAIAREVDRAHFGGERVTPAQLAEVAARARGIVTRAATALVAIATIVLLGACTDYKPQILALDPAGNELFVELLEKDGVNVAPLEGSLATLPMPMGGKELAPLVVVDASRVALEDETRAHLVRWVEEGGVLLLAGDVAAWPESFKVKPEATSSRAINVLVEPLDTDDGDDDDNQSTVETYATFPAKVATPSALSWPGSSTLAATDTHEVYAAARGIKKGLVLGFATDDLFTNVGIAREPNAAALVAILQTYAGSRKIRIAGPEDGISPPTSPVASLVHAGLGLGMAHAAAAAMILMLAFGVRQARAKMTPPPARRAWTEHIEATGGLYARAKLAPHALWAYARFVDGRLRERMPRGMSDPAAFLAIRANADPAWTADVWRRAIAARPADRPEGDELLTLRHLSALYAAAVKSE